MPGVEGLVQRVVVYAVVVRDHNAKLRVPGGPAALEQHALSIAGTRGCRFGLSRRCRVALSVVGHAADATEDDKNHSCDDNPTNDAIFTGAGILH